MLNVKNVWCCPYLRLNKKQEKSQSFACVLIFGMAETKVPLMTATANTMSHHSIFEALGNHGNKEFKLSDEEVRKKEAAAQHKATRQLRKANLVNPNAILEEEKRRREEKEAQEAKKQQEEADLLKESLRLEAEKQAIEDARLAQEAEAKLKVEQELRLKLEAELRVKFEEEQLAQLTALRTAQEAEEKLKQEMEREREDMRTFLNNQRLQQEEARKVMEADLANLQQRQLQHEEELRAAKLAAAAAAAAAATAAMAAPINVAQPLLEPSEIRQIAKNAKMAKETAEKQVALAACTLAGVGESISEVFGDPLLQAQGLAERMKHEVFEKGTFNSAIDAWTSQPEAVGILANPWVSAGTCFAHILMDNHRANKDQRIAHARGALQHSPNETKTPEMETMHQLIQALKEERKQQDIRFAKLQEEVRAMQTQPKSIPMPQTQQSPQEAYQLKGLAMEIEALKTLLRQLSHSQMQNPPASPSFPIPSAPPLSSSPPPSTATSFPIPSAPSPPSTPSLLTPPTAPTPTAPTPTAPTPTAPTPTAPTSTAPTPITPTPSVPFASTQTTVAPTPTAPTPTAPTPTAPAPTIPFAPPPFITNTTSATTMATAAPAFAPPSSLEAPQFSFNLGTTASVMMPNTATFSTTGTSFQAPSSLWSNSSNSTQVPEVPFVPFAPDGSSDFEMGRRRSNQPWHEQQRSESLERTRQREFTTRSHRSRSRRALRCYNNDNDSDEPDDQSKNVEAKHVSWEDECEKTATTQNEIKYCDFLTQNDETKKLCNEHQLASTTDKLTGEVRPSFSLTPKTRNGVTPFAELARPQSFAPLMAKFNPALSNVPDLMELSQAPPPVAPMIDFSS